MILKEIKLNKTIVLINKKQMVINLFHKNYINIKIKETLIINLGILIKIQ